MGQCILLKTVPKGVLPLVATNSSDENKSTATGKKFETDSGTEIGFAKYLILGEVWLPPSVGSAAMSEEDSEFW